MEEKSPAARPAGFAGGPSVTQYRRLPAVANPGAYVENVMSG
jgi:hypothetical protein